MADRPNAYVHKNLGDIIRSDDWNELQIQAREEIYTHRHTGKDDGTQIPREGIAANAIDGSLVDPAAKITVDSLTTTGNLSVTGTMMLGDITDLLDKIKKLDKDKLGVSDGSYLGTFRVRDDLLIGGKIAVGASLPLAKLHVVNTPQDAATGSTFIIGSVPVITSPTVSAGLYPSGEETRNPSYLSLGYHETHSWMQAYNGYMAINPLGGNVGIGTTTPFEALEVNGRIKSGPLRMGAWSGDSSYLYIGNDQLDTSNPENYALLQGATGETYISSPTNLYVGVSGTNRMHFSSDGKIQVDNKLQIGTAGIGNWQGDASCAFFGSNLLDQSNLQNYALLQDGRNGYSYLNSPTSLYLCVGGGAKMTMDNSMITVAGRLHVPGGISGSWMSDLRLKKDITPLENPLAKLLTLRGLSFSWIDETYGKDREIGVIAQEVEAVFPELVNTIDDQKMVNYVGLIPILIEAIKEQQKQIDLLREAKV
jgi:hypothetical protein